MSDVNGVPEGVVHTMVQAKLGEFATYKGEAEMIGPEAFAAKYGHKVWGWGRPEPFYHCVRHEGTDYLWRIDDGKFDGWDGVNLPPREER